MRERRLSFAPHGHMLTNAAVWSGDSRWLVYDARSDPAGSDFDGTVIERVDVENGRVERRYPPHIKKRILALQALQSIKAARQPAG